MGIFHSDVCAMCFVFDAVEDGSVVDDWHWWPDGPLIVVRFNSLSQCLQLAPRVTLANLQSLATAHCIDVPHKCRKQDVIDLLCDHICHAC